MEFLSEWNFWGDYAPDLISRPFYSQRMQELFSRKVALIILGIRRAGKSSISQKYIKDLIDAGDLDVNETLFINLEDPRLPPEIDSDLLMKIFETYISEKDPEDPVIVLDEVQDVIEWERFVRYLIESRKRRVIITGSSSKVLDDEVSDILTGRHVNLEVTTLDLGEFFLFKNIHNVDIDPVKDRNLSRKVFHDYCGWGGFPEVVISSGEKMKKELLNSYFNDILIKDVVIRFNVTEVKKLESLAHLYVSGITDLVSFNKISDILGISLDTVEKYSIYLEKARLFFFLDKFDWSRFKQMRSQKKVYTTDIGFHKLKGFKFSENRGKVLENIVAIELKRRCSRENMEIYYWRDYQDHEIDFIVKKDEKIKSLIQVSAVNEINEIKEREYRSLLKGEKLSECKDLIIITEDLEEEIVRKDVLIRIVPAWKWLLFEKY